MAENNTVNFKEQKKILQQKKQNTLKKGQYKSKATVIFQTIILLAVVTALCHYCTTG